MTAITTIAALLAGTAAAQTAYELPRPTSLTVTNGLVECADAAGCVVQRACGAPTTPFGNSDFAQVGNPLAEGETLETPRTNRRAETCAVRVLRNDGTGDGATANVTGLRYVKLKAAHDSLHVVGVAETAVHRARTVTSMEVPPVSAASGGNLLAYLFERYNFDIGEFGREQFGEECDHILRGAPEYEECVRDQVEYMAFLMVDVADTPYTRCLVDTVEMQCDHGLCLHDNPVWEILDEGGFTMADIRYGGVILHPDAPEPVVAKHAECRAMAKDALAGLGFELYLRDCDDIDGRVCWDNAEWTR